MIAAPHPTNEAQRLAELRGTGLLDSMPEKEFDDLALLASHICGTPIGLITLVDQDRQWFKAKLNFEGNQTSREVSFCAHTIVDPEGTMIVPDALADPRFADNPLVQSAPNIRFYAGTSLVTPSGSALGALCVIDQKPHQLSSEQRLALAALGRQTMSLIELRRRRHEVEEASRVQTELMGKLRVEKERADRLLLSIFPEPVANQLKADLQPECVSQSFPEATIAFAELDGFWQAAECRSAPALIELLNSAFSLLDRLAEKHGIDRLKTINDVYMGIAGLRDVGGSAVRCTATAAAMWALDVQREIASLENKSRVPFSVRIGIHTGSVVGGVVGRRKIAYDVWGPTVTLASEMLASSDPGTIQLSQSTFSRIEDKFVFEDRGEFYVRGVGDVATYLLKGRLGS